MIAEVDLSELEFRQHDGVRMVENASIPVQDPNKGNPTRERQEGEEDQRKPISIREYNEFPMNFCVLNKCTPSSSMYEGEKESNPPPLAMWD